MNDKIQQSSKEAINILKEATLKLFKNNPAGLYPNQIGHSLNINFDEGNKGFGGFLPHYLIQILARENKIVPTGIRPAGKRGRHGDSWKLRSIKPDKSLINKRNKAIGILEKTTLKLLSENPR